MIEHSLIEQTLGLGISRNGCGPGRAEHEALVLEMERLELRNRHVGQRNDMRFVILRALGGKPFRSWLRGQSLTSP